MYRRLISNVSVAESTAVGIYYTVKNTGGNIQHFGFINISRRFLNIMATENSKIPERAEPETEDLLFRRQIEPYGEAGKPKPFCTKKKLLIIAIVLVMLLLYALGLGIGLAVGLSRDRVTEDKPIEVKIPIGAVVTDHEACSEIGRQILERHGTAVDAAIAALICNGVRTPHSMGIGGGCFMVVYDRSVQSAVIIDGRETAPGRMTHDLFMDLRSKNVRAGMIGVPGELKAYKLAHDIYGRLPWKDLFEPTIEMMRDGFPLSTATAKALQVVLRFGIKLTDFPLLCEIFCSNTTTGEVKQEGDIIYMPNLLTTLKGIAKDGPDYIYESPVTVKIVKELKGRGGLFENIDFTMNYEPLMESAMKFDFGEYNIYTMGGSTGGPVLGLILSILKGLQFSGDDLSSTDRKVETYHKIIEAIKFAYADRYGLGDPLYENSTIELLRKMQSEKYASYLRQHIDFTETHDVSYYTSIAGEYSETEGTSHVSVLSPYGDAVSVTSTINYYFGSGIVSNTTGIIWNNEMQDFDTTPTNSPNLVKPGKRPRSSMCPVIVVQKSTGQVKLVTGAAGGSKITTSTAQFIARLLLLGQSLEEATKEKRFHHMLYGNTLYVEKGFPEDIISGLNKSKKHNVVKDNADFMAVVESILTDDNGVIQGYADRRKSPGKTSYMYEFNMN